MGTRLPWQFLAVVLVAVVTRFPGLGLFPPSGEQGLLLRLPFALAGVLSIMLYMAVVVRQTARPALGYWSGLSLALMPWHIEQSRIISPALLGVTVLLGGIWCYGQRRTRKWRLGTIVVTAGLFWLVYPSYELFSGQWLHSGWSDLMDHSASLISGEFLFYKNDSLWQGGMRLVGVFLPTVAPLFLFGLSELFGGVRWEHWPWIAGFIAMLLVAGANSRFPEGSAFFLATPYLALVTGFGLAALSTAWRSSRLMQVVLFGYVCLILYEYVWFFHLYSVHYSQRIESEIPYANRTF